MLTESFFVRRVKKIKDPETGELRPDSDEEGEVGVVRTLNLVQIPDPTHPTGMRLATLLGVCWEKSNYPAICWEDPEDLEHMDDTLDSILTRLKEDYVEGEEAFLPKMLEKLFDFYGPEAVIGAVRDFLPDQEEEEEEEEEEEGREGSVEQPAN